MKKAIGQTVRDIKREVNKKVLKVPSIEQKVLDATNNESWGPHGSLLADIAQATRNYPEHQMIMTVIWKRINDTGKNWRHVYKALTVLEYLVAHGSERVIDDIKEHAYQISTLSNFQYIDSSGSDQGSSVRRKSQALVGLVNDKEKLQEARQKAAANRDKFRGRSPTGGMYKTSSYSNFGGHGDRYDEERFDDRSSYERERECNYREDDQYGRNGDPYGRDLDRYSRDSDERNTRENYRDDVIRGRSQNIDEYQYGSRSKSADRERTYEDDGQNPSRGSMGAENQPQDSRRLDRKFSEQNLSAPPSYVESVSAPRSPYHGDRDRETSAAPALKPPSPPVALNADPPESTFISASSEFPAKHEIEAFDEFDPRRSVRGAPTSPIIAETDFLGSLSESFSSNPLAITASGSGLGPSETNATVNSVSEPTFCATSPSSSLVNQPFDDPFGDSPFKAFPSSEPVISSTSSLEANMNKNSGFPPPISSAQNFEFGDTQQANNADILADILPLSGPPTHHSFAMDHQTGFSLPFATPVYHPPAAPPSTNVFGAFDSQMVLHQTQPHQPSSMDYSEKNHVAAVSPAHNKDVVQATHNNPSALAIVPKASVSASQDKFDPKSTVWADTLSKGLVDLNISGAKINPLADIGIDFDAINRKDKRMEKPSSAAAATSSNVMMGKAMGFGSGIGRSGASALRTPTNPNTMMSPGMGMGMGIGGGPNMGLGLGPPGMSMGGYGAMNQQPVPMWGQGGGQMQAPAAAANSGGLGLGLAPGTPGAAYNPALMGTGYGAQQPYSGGGYR